jgi:3'-phosphoadenosine 5'-phosphosulfate sulfotransferase (PAPS reductase)/FAD synthetase
MSDHDADFMDAYEILDMTTLAKPFAKFDHAEFSEALINVPHLVDQAIERLRNSPFDQEHLFLGHSGGKDSILVTYLADLAFGFEEIPIIHNPKPTGVENQVHPLTQEFLYRLAAKRNILYSPTIPEWFKVQIDGTRIVEWTREDGRSVDIIKDGQSVSRKDMTLYMEHGLFDRSFIYPIFDWQDVEVWAAIYRYSIPYSPEYDL